MTEGAGPLDVLVVGWFPAAEDPIAGRFVADQAAALLATGRVRPAAVSFEPFPLQGDLGLRQAAVDAWGGVVHDAGRAGWAFASRGSDGPDGVPVVRLGVPHGGSRGAARTNQAVHRASALAALLDGAAGGGWPMLHAHVGYPEGAAVATIARARGISMILTEHATYLDRLFADPEIRAAYLQGAQTAARIIAVSQVLAERIGREFPELRQRITVIPNTVDVDAFRAVGLADRDPDELLWVGYRREVKGMPALLEAFRIVRDARPSTRLRLIGRSTTEAEEMEWHRLAAELGVADAVAFEAPADRAGVARAMERAALFVHPSRNETMGIVAVEALAAGLPVVAVDSGGVTEVLGPTPQAFGALVARQDPELLAAAILATLERRRDFGGDVLRAHVVDRYGAPAVALRIANLYAEVLAEASGGAAVPAVPPRPIRAPTPPPARVVVVGFDRSALDLSIAAFPSWVLRDTVIVTSGPAVAGHSNAVRLPDQVVAELAELLSLQGRSRGRGIAGLIKAVPRWLTRRWQRDRLVGRVLPVLTGAIGDAVARSGGDATTVVCLGGIDVVAAEPLRTAGAITVAPGGLRWLGDRRQPALRPEHAAQPPEASSR